MSYAHFDMGIPGEVVMQERRDREESRLRERELEALKRTILILNIIRPSKIRISDLNEEQLKTWKRAMTKM